MLIEIYVYSTQTGEFMYKDTGDPNFVISDLTDDKDFTLTPPPDSSKQWRWVNHAWQQEQKND